MSQVDRRDMLARFFKIQKENPEKFDDVDVTILATLNIFGGSDTTSVSLRAIFWYLIQNPKSYDYLMAELDSAIAKGALSHNATFAQTQRLPYLQAVVKEAMRIHPALGTNHTRFVPAGGMRIADKFIPEGVESEGSPTFGLC